nr:hypothetical protein [uncultured Prevotella sp.]
MKDNRDALNFGTMNVPRLFVKLFSPALMGLFSLPFSIWRMASSWARELAVMPWLR